MYPEDRVLVAVMNRPRDFGIARDQGWYRVPEKKAPQGVFAEYVAFYFTAAFGDLKWAVHYYARRLGHELVTRRALLPDELDHARADERYYKLQLGPLQRREPPIVSRRWRRITFIHTTWDRFQAAEEINDLFSAGGPFVDRLYHALRESGLAPERRYPVREAGVEYVVDLAVPCRRGTVVVGVAEEGEDPPGALRLPPERVTADLDGCLAAIHAAVGRRGGVSEDAHRCKITVKLGAPLSQVVGERKVVLSLPLGTTAAGALDELRARYPDFEAGLRGKGLRRPFGQALYTLFVNARPVSWERAEITPLRDGDRLYLFLPVAGGS